LAVHVSLTQINAEHFDIMRQVTAQRLFPVVAATRGFRFQLLHKWRIQLEFMIWATIVPASKPLQQVGISLLYMMMPSENEHACHTMFERFQERVSDGLVEASCSQKQKDQFPCLWIPKT
jgi:hypothetical protein